MYEDHVPCDADDDRGDGVEHDGCEFVTREGRTPEHGGETRSRAHRRAAENGEHPADAGKARAVDETRAGDGEARCENECVLADVETQKNLVGESKQQEKHGECDHEGVEMERLKLGGKIGKSRQKGGASKDRARAENGDVHPCLEEPEADAERVEIPRRVRPVSFVRNADRDVGETSGHPVSFGQNGTTCLS